MAANDTVEELAHKFLKFSDASPTPFQLVDIASEKLTAHGFNELDEKETWIGNLEKGKKYFFHRNHSTLVAFTVGDKYKPGNPFKAIGAHTDSPVLKVKPISKKTAHGYLQVAVECYGGGLWHTWFDRELTIAGRVIVRSESGKFEARNVKVNRPILRVPNLCIHLQTADERGNFKPNKETQLTPILAMTDTASQTFNAEGDDRHVPALIAILAETMGCKPDAIVDLELTLCDTQPGQIWGAANEFLSAPRLDNQIHCFTSIEALITHAEDLSNDSGIAMIALFDHEEVGSRSDKGAGSPVFRDAIVRITESFDEGSTNTEMFKISLSKSLLLSADVAHAIHPNYAHKHEDNHQPKLNKGTVLKINDNQRYATDAVSGFFFRELARQCDECVQEFVVRNDCPCGSTIGPIVAANTGLRTVDIGVPSLSMHSIRETIGIKDIKNNFKILSTFFAEFETLYSNFSGW